MNRETALKHARLPVKTEVWSDELNSPSAVVFYRTEKLDSWEESHTWRSEKIKGQPKEKSSIIDKPLLTRHTD